MQNVKTWKAFDIETTGFNPYHGDTIFAFVITDAEGYSIVHRLDNTNKKYNIISKNILIDFFQDTTIGKIAHNCKFEISFVKKLLGKKYPEGTFWHDTMIMSQLLNNLEASHSLEALGTKFLKYPIEQDERIDGAMRKLKRINKSTNYSHIHKVLMSKYQVADGERCMLLYQIMIDDILADSKLYEDYLNELLLIKATERMESFGIKLDVEGVLDLVEFLEKEVNESLAYCFKEFGKDVNFNSPKQLKALLYDQYKLPVIAYTPTGNPSTDKETLVKYREQFPELKFFDHILKLRSYSKGISMVTSYKNLTDKNGIIHPNINTNQARTGRQSCSNPNLHNVQKSNEVSSLFSVPARRAFRARPGRMLFFIDYSGIELRLLVDSSKETELIDAIQNGKDPHSITAEVVFGELFTKASKKLKYFRRNKSKTLAFAYAYGSNDHTVYSKVLEDEDKSVHDEIIEGVIKWKNKFPNLANFTKIKMEEIYEKGYITTAFGRKLYVDRDKAYIAANYDIQGTAAGILKRALVQLDDFYRIMYQDEVRLVLSIHDEIIISIPRNYLKYKDDILKHTKLIMIEMPEIKVPLAVEAEYTKLSWNNLKEVEI